MFWESLQAVFATKLRLSFAYHPQTNDQSERTIPFVEDLLRVCVLEQGVNWSECLPLIEFTYKNSFYSSIRMEPFEALYGRRCRTLLCWYESGESVMIGPGVVQQTTEKVKFILQKINTSQSMQKSYHDKRMKDIEFQVGDHMFLRVNLIDSLSRKQKSSKRDFGCWHDRVTGGTGRAKLLTWGFIFLHSIFVFSARISSKSPIFCSKTQSLEYLFLKLNDLQLK